MRLTRLFIHTRHHPSAILLMVQLAGMLLYPFIERTPESHVAFNAFGIVVLAFTIRMVRRTPGETRFSIALAVPIYGWGADEHPGMPGLVALIAVFAMMWGLSAALFAKAARDLRR